MLYMPPRYAGGIMFGKLMLAGSLLFVAAGCGDDDPVGPSEGSQVLLSVAVDWPLAREAAFTPEAWEVESYGCHIDLVFGGQDCGWSVVTSGQIPPDGRFEIEASHRCEEDLRLMVVGYYDGREEFCGRGYELACTSARQTATGGWEYGEGIAGCEPPEG